MGADALGFALVMLVIGMTIAMYMFRKTALAAVSAGSWLLLMVYSYSLSVYPASFDIYVGVSLFSFAMLVVCIISGVTFLTGDKKSEENIVDEYRAIRSEFEEMQKEQDSIAFLYKKPKKKGRLLR